VLSVEERVGELSFGLLLVRKNTAKSKDTKHIHVMKMANLQPPWNGSGMEIVTFWQFSRWKLKGLEEGRIK